MNSTLKRKPDPLCAVCEKPFLEARMGQKVCGYKCAAKIHKVALEKRKEAIKSRSDWLREAQTAFNAFIRARDAHLPCISCGRDNDCKINAGHYLSVGSHPELRFSEDNCHKQCEHCNTYKSGNQAAYRPRLIERIGAERVEWLEGHHEATKYTVEQIKGIKETYKLKIKLLHCAIESV